MTECVHRPLRVLKTQAQQRYTLGVVYAPGEVDSQGDYAEAPEIEQACWDFMRRLQGRDPLAKLGAALAAAVAKAHQQPGAVQIELPDTWEDLVKGRGLGLQHREFGSEIGDIVECYLLPADCEIGGETVPQGSWLLGVVWSPEHFAKVQSGEITGLSMGGKGRRVPVG